MKKWIVGITLTGMIVGYTPTAWAGDCLWRADVSTTSDQIPMHMPSTAQFGPIDHPSGHFDIRSSVQVSRDVLKEAYDASRIAYTKKLEKYAKCSIGEAKKAVISAHPGMKIDSIQLRNIRTNLVYVALAEDDEDKYLVVVDAGDGKILLDRPVPTHHERVFADH